MRQCRKFLWDKIQNAAKNIANNIGNFINGFTDRFDWTLLGTTIGNGINTAFLFSNTLLKTINWGNIGTSIANFKFKYINNRLESNRDKHLLMY